MSKGSQQCIKVLLVEAELAAGLADLEAAEDLVHPEQVVLLRQLLRFQLKSAELRCFDVRVGEVRGRRARVVRAGRRSRVGYGANGAKDWRVRLRWQVVSIWLQSLLSDVGSGSGSEVAKETIAGRARLVVEGMDARVLVQSSFLRCQ